MHKEIIKTLCNKNKLKENIISYMYNVWNSQVNTTYTRRLSLSVSITGFGRHYDDSFDS